MEGGGGDEERDDGFRTLDRTAWGSRTEDDEGSSRSSFREISSSRTRVTSRRTPPRSPPACFRSRRGSRNEKTQGEGDGVERAIEQQLLPLSLATTLASLNPNASPSLYLYHLIIERLSESLRDWILGLAPRAIDVSKRSG